MNGRNGKARRILLASIGEARLASNLCPCDLDQDTRSRTRVPKGHRIIAGCSEAWYRAWFGTRRSWVQIPPARFQSTAVAERSPRRQTVGSNPTSAIEPYALRLYCALSSAHLRVRSRPATPLRTADATALGLDPCVKHRNPKKTGVWHKRLYTVIVEANPFFPCIPLSRS